MIHRSLITATVLCATLTTAPVLARGTSTTPTEPTTKSATHHTKHKASGSSKKGTSHKKTGTTHKKSTTKKSAHTPSTKPK